jgi:K+-sensing histidine kinase KdpD
LLPRFAAAAQQRHSRLIQSESARRTNRAHVCVGARRSKRHARVIERQLTEPLMNHACASEIYFLVATSDVAAGRHQRVKQLQSLGKFDAIARL